MKRRTPEQWVAEMRKGDRLALARVISKLENRDADAEAIVRALFSYTGNAQTLGITGPPGAGKSTLVNQLAVAFRKQGKKVGILCVDPSSPFTGGAILGDRIRMQGLQGDSGVFIRSLGTRGAHGGLSRATQESILALDAAGMDIVILETAGVGQTELDVLEVAQSVLVVLVPESGDGIQVLKAGLMEIADLFVVNKADRPEADRMVNELEALPHLNSHHAAVESWVVPALKSQALLGTGIDAIVEAFSRHQDYLTTSGERIRKRAEFSKRQVESILLERLSESLKSAFETNSGKEVLAKLGARTLTPSEAADMISQGSGAG